MSSNLPPEKTADHGNDDERKPLLGWTGSVAILPPDESTQFKIFKTGILVVTWIFIGIFTAMVSATIVDLVKISNSDFASFGETLTGLKLGMSAGSIMAAFLCGRYPHKLDLLLSISLTSLGLSTAALPWLSSLGRMAAVLTIEGVSRGVITCCGNVMIMRLWMENSPAPLHAMHFGTGFGSFVAPLMSGPFLAPQGQGNWSGNTSTNHDAVFTPRDTVHGHEYSIGNYASSDNTSSRIFIPYGIEGGYGIICAIFFLGFYLRQNTKTTRFQTDIHAQSSVDSSEKAESASWGTALKTALKTASPGSCARGHVAFGVQMSAILFFCSMCIVGLITSYSIYIMPIAMVGKPHFSEHDATYLASAFWGCFALGRLASSVVAKWTAIQIMIVTEMIISLGTAAGLAFCGLDSAPALWAFTCSFAFFSAPLFPSLIAWTNLYLDINGPLMAVLQCGIGCGATLSSFLGGYGLQHYGANFPLYVNLAWAILLVVFFVVVQIRASLHGRKLPGHVIQSDFSTTNGQPDAVRIND